MSDTKYQRVRIMAKAEELKAARVALGYNIPDLARYVGVTRSMLYQVERGTSGVSDKTAYAICQRLGKSLSELFEFVWPNVQSMERTLREGEQVGNQLPLTSQQ